MRRVIWPLSGLAGLLIVIAAAFGLRGTAPDRTAAPVAAPPAAVADAPLPKPPAPPPSFDVVTVDPHGQAVIAGRALPGDRVRVLDGDTPLGEVTADARGEWVLVPDRPIAPGKRQLSLEASAEGGPARRSADVVALSVAPAGTGATMALLLPGDAGRPARILQRPESEPGHEPGQGLSLDSAEYGEADRLVLSGRADPGARLSVYLGDRLLGATAADNAGKWALTVAQLPAAGGVELRLEQLAADGSVARRLAVPFDRPVPASGTYVVQRGNSLWRIALQTYGNGSRYAAIYAANRGRIQDPDLIYPGQQFTLPKP